MSCSTIGYVTDPVLGPEEEKRVGWDFFDEFLITSRHLELQGRIGVSVVESGTRSDGSPLAVLVCYLFGRCWPTALSMCWYVCVARLFKPEKERIESLLLPTRLAESILPDRH